MRKSLIALLLLLTVLVVAFESVVSVSSTKLKHKNNRSSKWIPHKKSPLVADAAVVEVESDSFIGTGSVLQVTEALKVRNGPCTDRGIITTLPAGTKVTYTGESSNSCGYVWHKVSGSFGTGFAASNWLKEVGAPAGTTYVVTEALKVRNGPCTDRGIITTLPAGTKVTYAGETSNSCGYVWRKVSGSFGTGFAASNWLKEAGSPTGATYVVTQALKVRNGPCTDRGIITTLPAGARVTLTGENHNTCGYQWLGISGSFGRGFAASNWLKPEGDPGTRCNARSYPLFKQCGQSWSGNRMGRSSITMCREGCLVSSISMALAGTGKSVAGQSANPGTLNSWLSNNGGYVNGNNFIWSSVNRLGLIHERYTSDKADMRASICAGKVVILTVKNGGHYVLATGVGNGVFYVNDAGYNLNSYTDGQVILAHIYRV